MSLPAIIGGYCVSDRHWRAWFDGSPCVSYGADRSTSAIRRLLEAEETPAGELELRFDNHHDDRGPLFSLIRWRPPELHIRCPQCNGNGEYVGLAIVEKCDLCDGHRWIAG